MASGILSIKTEDTTTNLADAMIKFIPYSTQKRYYDKSCKIIELAEYNVLALCPQDICRGIHLNGDKVLMCTRGAKLLVIAGRICASTGFLHIYFSSQFHCRLFSLETLI